MLQKGFIQLTGEFFFNIYAIQLDIIKVLFIHDAVVSCLKKTVLKFTWKQLWHVLVLQLHHRQGAH